MLTELSRDIPNNTIPENNSKPISDPWELPTPKPKTNPIPEAWKLPLETLPSIAPAGCPNAPKLPIAHLSKPVELLWKNWLKLRSQDAQKLAAEIQQAVGLLYWLEIVR